MRLLATVNGADIGSTITGEIEELRTVATAAVRESGSRLRARLQVDATSTLGPRIANAWRQANFPPTGKSARAAALVYTNAPDIIDGFDKGATIRPTGGQRFLAIPTEYAGRVTSRAGTGRRTSRRATPTDFAEAGIPLRFIPAGRFGRFPVLVVDDVRLGKRGPRVARGRSITGRATVVAFILIPQTKLPKLIDLSTREREALADMATVWARYTN